MHFNVMYNIMDVDSYSFCKIYDLTHFRLEAYF